MRIISTILILSLTLSVINANSIHRQYRNLVEPNLNENLEKSEIKLKPTELIPAKLEQDVTKDEPKLTKLTPETPEVKEEKTVIPLPVKLDANVEQGEKLIELRNLEPVDAVLKQNTDVVDEKVSADVKEVVVEKEPELSPQVSAILVKQLEEKLEPVKQENLIEEKLIVEKLIEEKIIEEKLAEEKLIEEKPVLAEVPVKKELESRADDIDGKKIKVEVIELPRTVDAIEPIKTDQEIKIEPVKTIEDIREIKEDKKKSKLENALELTDDLETKKNTIEIEEKKILETVVPIENLKQKDDEKEDRKIDEPISDAKPEKQILPELLKVSENKIDELKKNEINVMVIAVNENTDKVVAEEKKIIEKIVEPIPMPVEEKKIEITEEIISPTIKKISGDEVRQNSNTPTTTQAPNLIQQLVANNPITNFINQVQQGLRPQTANVEGAAATTEQPNIISQGIQNFQNTIQGFQNGLQNLVNPNAANQTANSTNAPFNIFTNIFPNQQQQQQQQPNPLQAVAQNIQNIFNPANRLSSTTTTTTIKPITDTIQNVDNKVDFVRNSDEVLTESNENYNEQEIYVGEDEIAGPLY